MLAAGLKIMEALTKSREPLSCPTGHVCERAGWLAMQQRMRWTLMRSRSHSRPASHGTHRPTQSADG